jgi:hypothetical protein
MQLRLLRTNEHDFKEVARSATGATGPPGMGGCAGVAKRTAAGRVLPVAVNERLPRSYDSFRTQGPRHHVAERRASALEVGVSRPLLALCAFETLVPLSRRRSTLFARLLERPHAEFRPAGLMWSCTRPSLHCENFSSTSGTPKGSRQ